MGIQLPSQKMDDSPPEIFGPCLSWRCGQTAGWIKMPLYWYEGRPRPRPLCVTWGSSIQLPPKGAHPPPNFRPMSIVAKRSPISATAEHLLFVIIIIMIIRQQQRFINTIYVPCSVVSSSASLDVATSVSGTDEEPRLPCRSADRKQFLQTLRRHCCGSNPGHSESGFASLVDGELISTR